MKKFSLALLLITLFSCVEGRSGRDSASVNEGIGGKTSLNFESELSLAYSKQKFYMVINALKLQFSNINFSDPADITGLQQCPVKILVNADAEKFQSYLDQLLIADGKYQKAIIAVNTKKQSLSISEDIEVLEAVLERLLEEQVQVKSHAQHCESVLDAFTNTPIEADCSSAEAKNTAAINKTFSLINLNASLLFADASELFSTNPIIEFTSYNELHSKVDCVAVANQNKARAIAYVDNILVPLKTPIDQAITLNNADLTSADACVKEIATKTKGFLDTYKTNNNNKLNTCATAIANVKPPVVYVATDKGLSVSIDGGESFTTKLTNTKLIEVMVGDNGYIYALTRSGVHISNNAGVSFKYLAGSANNSMDIYIHAGVLYLSTWNSHLRYILISEIFNTNASFKQKTSSNNPNHSFSEIAIDNDNALYAATDAGLAVSLDLGNSYLNSTLNTDNGLVGNNVRGVIIENNKIYVSTTVGLSIVNEDGSIINRTKENSGLGGNQLEKHLFVKDGVIYAPTKEGLSISFLDAAGDVKFTNYKTPYMPTTGDDKDKGVVGVFVDRNGKIYASTNAGLAITTAAGQPFSFKSVANSGLVSNAVRAVFVK